MTQETKTKATQQASKDPSDAVNLLTQFANAAAEGNLAKVMVLGFTKEGSVISAASAGMTFIEGNFLCDVTKNQLMQSAINAGQTDADS